MTFSVLTRLSHRTITDIVDHLNEAVSPHLTPDVSSYARGRQRVWLEAEAPLSREREWAPGLHDERLWSWLTRTTGHFDFVPEIGLATRGTGIRRHRDASYAGFRAIGVNLAPCQWVYENLHKGFEWDREAPDSGPEQIFDLSGGEVFEFNCKNPHTARQLARGRWGINLWTVSDRERSRFRRFQADEAQPALFDAPVPKPRVIHKRDATGGPDEVYIGRPSRWGNTYSHIQDRETLAEHLVGSREEAIAAYETWVRDQPDLMAVVHTLRDKTLVCWCAPKACHGDVLVRLAEEQTPS